VKGVKAKPLKLFSRYIPKHSGMELIGIAFTLFTLVRYLNIPQDIVRVKAGEKGCER